MNKLVLVSFLMGIATAAAQDPGKTSYLRLTGGTINGQGVSASNRTITVQPGGAITGTLNVSITSTYGSGSVMAMGLTPTWGEPASSFVDLGGFSTPVTALKRTVNVNLAAPSAPGIYYVILAFSGEFTAAQVMSCTSWDVASPVWDNGDDVAKWSTPTITTANNRGNVKVNYLDTSGNAQYYMPATAIQIKVTTDFATAVFPQPNPQFLSALHVSGGTINGQTISPANPQISVARGSSITGSFTVKADSALGSVTAIGMTPTWGPHSTSYTDLGYIPSPTTGYPVTAQVNLTAPTAPGTYYIIAAFNGEFTAAQVLSASNWSEGPVIWDNGDDVAGWSGPAAETAIADGTVLVYYEIGANGIDALLYMPATAIRVIVK